MSENEQKDAPQLKLCAAEWTLMRHPSAEKEWSMDRKLKEVREAGFYGFSAGPSSEVAQACAKWGMELVGMVDIGSTQEVGAKLDRFKGTGAVHVNVQLCDHDTPTETAVSIARAAQQYGESLGLKPAIEWHRDTCTETPEKGLALIDEYQLRYGETLRVNFDYSHPGVVKHLSPDNFWERLSEYRVDLFKQSQLVHFRPFTGSHCQTPVTDGRGKLDLDFIAWRDSFLRPAIATWLEDAQPDQTLWAVVELGPKGSGYALNCFPNVWDDSIVAKNEIQSIWNELVEAEGNS